MAPLRIGIQGWGSEGDLRPLVALAARLKQEGHEPRLVLSPVDGMDWEAVCQTLGLELTLAPKHMDVSLESICRSSQSADPSKVSRQLLELAFFPYQDAMYEAGLELCGKSDLVVGLFSSHYVKAACLKSRTPFVCLHYYPGMVPTRQQPPVGFPAWSWLNPLAWKLFGAVLDMAFRAPAARFFESKGLPKVRHSIPDVLFSGLLNLHATSPTLFPPPSDFGELHQVCGAFELPEEPKRWRPPKDLAEFLEDGPPPLLCSMGTMELLAPQRSQELLVAAVNKAKLRAVIQSKCRPDEGRDGNVYYLKWAPHRELLPRCSALVMHGGAGTTHAALRSGRPAVALPFIFEQKIWGELLQKAGSALEPLDFWKATPEALALRLTEVSSSTALRQRAEQLAQKVSQEDGTGSAVRLLENAAHVSQRA